MAAPNVAYPAIEAHGIIGDRRTAALVAADGTIDWLCLPDYDGDVIFGALLDAGTGGFWRIGPDRRVSGRQRYQRDTFALQTRWSLPEGEMEPTDVMLWPKTDRGPELSDARAIVRCVRARKARVRCRVHGYRGAQPIHGQSGVPAIPTRFAGISRGLRAHVLFAAASP